LKIPLYKAFTDANDVRRVASVVRRGMNWAIGPEVAEFEREVASYVGRKHAVSFNSGTSALHATMMALKVKQGDEVVVPSFTFIATANAALFVGASPVFADIERVTYGLDPESVGKVITRKTRAVVPTHIGGIVCRYAGELERLGRERKLLVVEDACEALGATAKGRKGGTYGDASVLSFCANKLISTGEGGMVLTDRKDVYERLKLVASHGRSDKVPYFTSSFPPDYVQLGYNWRVSSMTAALGISQMRKLDRAIQLRRQVARALTSRFSRMDGIEPPGEPQGYLHTYQMYTVKVRAGRSVRDGLNGHLSSRGITSKVYFDPIHRSRFYKGILRGRIPRLPVTDWVSARVLTIPVYPRMSRKEVDYVADSVEEYFAKRG
jgi:dTDP-4-amino-4,6-dideoxygalactose transaminase